LITGRVFRCEIHTGLNPKPTALWLVSVFACAVVVTRSHFVADMSAFLPRKPTAQQQILVDEVTRGSLSRTLLLGIEGATVAQRALLSRELAQSMHRSGNFALISNGESSDEESEAELLLRYRYLLSRRVTPERFTVAGLHQAIASNIENLAGLCNLVIRHGAAIRVERALEGKAGAKPGESRMLPSRQRASMSARLQIRRQKPTSTQLVCVLHDCQ